MNELILLSLQYILLYRYAMPQVYTISCDLHHLYSVVSVVVVVCTVEIFNNHNAFQHSQYATTRVSTNTILCMHPGLLLYKLPICWVHSCPIQELCFCVFFSIILNLDRNGNIITACFSCVPLIWGWVAGYNKAFVQVITDTWLYKSPPKESVHLHS